MGKERPCPVISYARASEDRTGVLESATFESLGFPGSEAILASPHFTASFVTRTETHFRAITPNP